MRRPQKSDTARGPLSAPRQQSPTALTLYDTLEVIPTASPETIHAAYRSLISRYHPDKVVGLGAELQAIANARTKEINYAYDILGDAARRASYDEELRDAESASVHGQDLPPAQSVCAAPPEVRAPRPDVHAPQPELRWPRPEAHGSRRRRLRATLFAATVGIAVLLMLMLAVNVLFSVIDFFVTGHDRYFQGVNSIDTNLRFSGLPYLLVMWVWLFANYMFGMISYRLGVRVGQRTAPGFGEPVTGTNDRLLLFLTFVCAVAAGELLFSAHTMPDILADMFILGGAYTAERAIT